MRARHRAALAVAAWISLMLAACANKAKEDILPQDGPTMKEVYDRHFHRPARDAAAGRATARRGTADGGGDLAGYTREAAAEVNAQFPRLPNPDLVIYVFPHLSNQGLPVPGYSTVAPLYETVEYAQPGEQEGWQ